MAPLQCVLGGPEGSDNLDKPSLEVDNDLADVVAAGAQDGEQGIPDRVLQEAARQAAVGFHVTDFGLDDAAAAGVGDQCWCQAAMGAADQHSGYVLAVAAIAAVYNGEVGALVGQDLHLLRRRTEDVAVVGMAWKAAHTDNKTLVQRGSDAGRSFRPVADAAGHLFPRGADGASWPEAKGQCFGQGHT